MPGGGKGDEKGKEVLWAQRCKLYTYVRRTKSWVQLGVGVGSIVRQQPPGRVDFTFEEGHLRVPVARHPVQAMSGLRTNSGTDKGWSWTAFDTIQKQDGKKEHWFTCKFSTMEVAESFKEALDTLKEDTSADVIPPGSPVSPSPSLSLSKTLLSPPDSPKQASHVSQPQPLPPDSPTRQSSQGLPSTKFEDTLLPGSPLANAARSSARLSSTSVSSPTLSSPPLANTERSGARLSSTSMSSPTQQSRQGQEIWLLYFEKGVFNQKNLMIEISAVYISVYSSKERALKSAVRAMDAHCDKEISWRDRECWDWFVDRRTVVGDRGVVIAVEAEDGTLNQVKLRKLPYDVDLPASGLTEGDQLWESVD